MAVDNIFFGDPNQRRLKAVAITFDVIAAMCQMDGTRLIKAKGWPEGAEIVGVTLDEKNKLLRLVLTHPMFLPLTGGMPVPDIPITHSYREVED